MKAVGSYLESKKNIIWDWNGTLVNDVDLCVSLLGKLMTENNLVPVSKEHHRIHFVFPIYDYYKKIGFQISDAEFKEMSEVFSKKFSDGIYECDLFEGARELLVELNTMGKRQAILSATAEEFLISQIKHFDIYHIFDRVYGLPDKYAQSKVNRGRQLMSDAGFESHDTILIGDTEHDLDVGEALGVEVLLIAQGHQSYDRLIGRHHSVLRDST